MEIAHTTLDPAPSYWAPLAPQYEGDFTSRGRLALRSAERAQVQDNVRVVTSLELEGMSVASGTSANFTEWSEMQATVLPVVSLQAGSFKCWGSAACIGNAGWFITAKHVVEPFTRQFGNRADGTTGLYVLWESNTPAARGVNNYLGALLEVVSVHEHGDADLVALTVRLPARAAELLRVAPLAFRMPEVGEPLALFGYSAMSLLGDVQPGERTTLRYERTFTVSVGEVLDRQTERRSPGMRGFPGVVTDAPIHSGMSGGAVFDMDGEIVGFASSSFPPTDSHPSWNSFVAVCGPALELAFLTREDDEDPLQETTLAQLVDADAVLANLYEGVDVDFATGKVVYEV